MRSEKGRAMDRMKGTIIEEAFTHEELGTFNISAMRRVGQLGFYGAPLKAKFFPDLIKFLKVGRDWEALRVWEILNDPKAPWENDPALVIYQGHDESHTIIDGTHRILARWVLGLPDFIFWMVPLSQAIMPLASLSLGNDWGKLEVRADGKLYDRKTGERHVNPFGRYLKS